MNEREKNSTKLSINKIFLKNEDILNEYSDKQKVRVHYQQICPEENAKCFQAQEK